jgi:ABC-type antimicrobial peptide transport system permease subunit
MKHRELGIRSALGASPGRLAGGVSREATIVLGLGSALGVAAIVIGRGLTDAFLSATASGSESGIAGSALLLGLVTLLGTLLLTIRAARLDAARALRAD